MKFLFSLPARHDWMGVHPWRHQYRSRTVQTNKKKKKKKDTKHQERQTTIPTPRNSHTHTKAAASRSHRRSTVRSISTHLPWQPPSSRPPNSQPRPMNTVRQGYRQHSRPTTPAQHLHNRRPVAFTETRAPSATLPRRPSLVISPQKNILSAASSRTRNTAPHTALASFTNFTVAAAATAAATTACLGAAAGRSIGCRRHLRDMHLHLLLRRKAVVKGLGKYVRPKDACRPPEARCHTCHVGGHPHGGVGAPRLPRLGKHRGGLIGERGQELQQSKFKICQDQQETARRGGRGGRRGREREGEAAR